MHDHHASIVKIDESKMINNDISSTSHPTDRVMIDSSILDTFHKLQDQIGVLTTSVQHLLTTIPLRTIGHTEDQGNTSNNESINNTSAIIENSANLIPDNIEPTKQVLSILPTTDTYKTPPAAFGSFGMIADPMANKFVLRDIIFTPSEYSMSISDHDSSQPITNKSITDNQLGPIIKPQLLSDQPINDITNTGINTNTDALSQSQSQIEPRILRRLRRNSDQKPIQLTSSVKRINNKSTNVAPKVQAITSPSDNALDDSNSTIRRHLFNAEENYSVPAVPVTNQATNTSGNHQDIMMDTTPVSIPLTPSIDRDETLPPVLPMIVQYEQQLSANKRTATEMFNDINDPNFMNKEITNRIVVHDKEATMDSRHRNNDPSNTNDNATNDGQVHINPTIPINDKISTNNLLSITNKKRRVNQASAKRTINANKRKFSTLSNTVLKVDDEPNTAPSTPVRIIQAMTKALHDNDDIMSIDTYTTNTAIDDNADHIINNNKVHPVITKDTPSVPVLPQSGSNIISAHQFVHGTESGHAIDQFVPHYSINQSNIPVVDTNAAPTTNTLVEADMDASKINESRNTTSNYFDTFREHSAMAVNLLKANQVKTSTMGPPQSKRKRPIIRATKATAFSDTSINRHNISSTSNSNNVGILNNNISSVNPLKNLSSTGGVTSILFAPMNNKNSIQSSAHPLPRVLPSGKEVLAVSITGGGDIADIHSTTTSVSETAPVPSHSNSSRFGPPVMLPNNGIIQAISTSNGMEEQLDSTDNSIIEENSESNIPDFGTKTNILPSKVLATTGLTTTTSTTSYHPPGQNTVAAATELANLIINTNDIDMDIHSTPIISQQPSLITDFEDVSSDDDDNLFSQSGLVMDDMSWTSSVPKDDDNYRNHNAEYAASTSITNNYNSHPENGQLSAISGQVVRLLLQARQSTDNIPQSSVTQPNGSVSSNISKGMSLTDLLE